jgi:hypothetical protein
MSSKAFSSEVLTESGEHELYERRERERERERERGERERREKKMVKKN